MLTKIEGNCQYKDCDQLAKFIASGRRVHQTEPSKGAYDVGFFCYEHSEIVSEYDSPEYIVVCPNCSCQFGVN